MAEFDVVVIKNPQGNTETGRWQGTNAKVSIGGSGANGTVEVKAGDGTQRVRVKASTAEVSVGGNGKHGRVRAFPQTADNTKPMEASVVVDGGARSVVLRDDSGTDTVRFDGKQAKLTLGAAGRAGEVAVFDEVGNLTVKLTGTFGVEIRDGQGRKVINLGPDGVISLAEDHDDGPRARFAPDGSVDLGGNGEAGTLRVHRADETFALAPDPEEAAIALDANGTMRAGGRGVAGRLLLHPSAASVGPTGVAPAAEKATVALEAESGTLRVGGHGVNGDVMLHAAGETGSLDASDSTVWLNAHKGHAFLGSNGREGQVGLFPAGAETIGTAATSTAWIGGESGAFIGGNGVNGTLGVFAAGVGGAASKTNANASILLDGATGDILLANADCAEEFDVRPNQDARPGSVMVITDEQLLELSRRPYDRRVAGILSGAGAYRPGIVLDRKAPSDHRKPLAVIGKVECRVTADEHPIATGDLLTSSNVPGHAMKAIDRDRAFGAVVGKALASLTSGRGLIPVLVALQ